MQTSFSRLIMYICFFVLGSALGWADGAPLSGELEKTDWNMKKDSAVAFIPAGERKDATITDEKVSYTQFDFAAVLMSSSWDFLFTKDGKLYQVQITRMYNLDKPNSAKTFQNFITNTVNGYTNKLGKPNVDEAKTMDVKDGQMMYGTMQWQANGKRTVNKDLQIEIGIIASGSLVFYTETCSNTGVKAE